MRPSWLYSRRYETIVRLGESRLAEEPGKIMVVGLSKKALFDANQSVID